ncbi:protein max-like [Arvicola amphibius]|uniref:protein max-like n=1 Tax=Arvicola amphibius TaxID=1047088 RepID=UPI001C0A3C86|nr:protein max-like [Arvicola amphibius]
MEHYLDQVGQQACLWGTVLIADEGGMLYPECGWHHYMGWRLNCTQHLSLKLLERKRRDHIKDSFHSLRDSVPSLQGEKASRAQILDKATEYIQYMRRKNHTHQQDIDDLKRQNALLEQQVRALEKARSSAQLQTNYPSSDNSLYTNAKGGTISAFDGGSDSSSESEPEEPQSRKKLRMEAS